MATPATKLEPAPHVSRAPVPVPEHQQRRARALRALENLKAGSLAALTIIAGWGLARPRGERPR